MEDRHLKLMQYRAAAEQEWYAKDYKRICLASEEKSFIDHVRCYYLQGFMDAMEYRDEKLNSGEVEG